MLSHKRRKKRQAHGLKTVELYRGKQGYGFTISGQQPCIIGNVVAGSPADLQGLRDGEHLVTVNGQAVAQLSHDQIVRVIGSSNGLLKLQIAEGGKSLHHDSDSSDEHYVKPRYTHRARSRSNSKMNHVSTDLQLPRRALGSAQVSNWQTSAVTTGRRSVQLPNHRGDNAFPTIYNPRGAVGGRASDFGVVRHTRQQESRTLAYPNRGTDEQGGQLTRSSSVPDVSTLDTKASGLSKMLYPAMQPVTLSSSSTINDDDQPSLRVIVGYIGSIEMPQHSNLPSSRLQSIRSAVRRLRVEQKVHTLVLLEVRSDGIRLSNPLGATIVHYPVERLAMSGMYPDDKRFFGLVTTQGGDDDNPSEGELSSSCHVFMVDPEFAMHNVHAAKAKTFGVHCTIDPNTQRCIEFPKSCAPILRTAARLYKDRHGGIFDVPRRLERQVSSDSDTNSDSGLGFHQGQDESMPTGDRVYVVDVHIPDDSIVQPPSVYNEPLPTAPPAGQRSQLAARSHTPLVTEAPAVKARPSTSTALTLSAFARRSSQQTIGNEGLSHLQPSNSKQAISAAAVSHDTLDPSTVEQLRSNMQRLLAKRKENVRDTQSLSDTESVVSDVRSRGSSGSRVSFNPRVAIATHHYPVVTGSRSSSSDSSSYATKREVVGHQAMPPRSRKQRLLRPEAPDRRAPPPIPPKPSLANHRSQQALSRQQSVPESILKTESMDGWTSRGRQSAAMSARTSDSLDSKLSPRAYPSTAPRPSRVVIGDRSAFQRFSSDHPNQPQMDFYNASYSPWSNRNNNNGSDNAPQTSNGWKEESADSGSEPKTLEVRQRPTPAPRPSRARNVHLTPASQSRSCSVPPENRRAWLSGEEVNVDNGLSVGSRPLNSAERQRQRQHGTTLDIDACEKAVSSESLVEVGSRGTDRTLPVTPKTSTVTNNNVGRVASWAVSFENLLEDEDGVKAFSEFLLKEYSHENIKFWLACKKFKALASSEEQEALASDIFHTYLSPQATEAVNIDSHAVKKAEEQLDSPSASMFDEAQCQVFTLMKRDSYSRFIKSAFYQSYLVREFEHDKMTEKEKLKFSASTDVDGDTQKRRILPNFLKDISRTLSTRPDKSSGKAGESNGNSLRKTWSSRSSEDSSLERTKPKKFEGSLTADLTTMKHRLDSGGSQEESEEVTFLRVELPDGSTSVMTAKPSDSLRSLLATLLARKSDLAITSIEAYPLNSDRVIDISQTMAEAGCAELRVEKRAVFRIALPDKRNVGVRAKLHRTVRDVLKPILLKYGFNIDDTVVLQGGEVVSPDVLVSTVDERKLTIIQKEQFQDWGITSRKAHINAQDLTNGWEDLVDFEDASTQDIGGSDSVYKKTRRSHFLSMLKNNSLDDGGKGTLKKVKGKNVTFGPTKSMDDRFLGNPKTNEMFLDMLTKAQSSRIDDQRGLSIDVSELPEFLKSSASGSNQQSEAEEGSISPPQTRVNTDRAHRLTTNSQSAPCYDQLNAELSADNKHERTTPYSYTNSTTLPHTYSSFQQTSAGSREGYSTPPSRLNSSYQDAIAGSTPDMDSTLEPGNEPIDETLTPKLPTSPLPTDLPPPPQFGNEAMTSTPRLPPPYRDAVHRSTLLTHSNTNNSNNNLHPPLTTLPGNNPGNRLSFAHHQPIIFNDEDHMTSSADRDTPSPTTHTLILDDPSAEHGNESSYNFYEQQYKSQRPSESVKVTFV